VLIVLKKMKNNKMIPLGLYCAITVISIVLFLPLGLCLLLAGVPIILFGRAYLSKQTKEIEN